MADLERFLRAQASTNAGFSTALTEMKDGRKQSHWIWYVFPQLVGLGHSEMAQRFAIADVEEARDFLADPVLGPRLLEIAQVVLQQLRPPKSLPLVELMGQRIDAAKLVSSLTLFGLVARQLPANVDPVVAERAATLANCCRDILDIAAVQGFSACAFTLRAVLAESAGGG